MRIGATALDLGICFALMLFFHFKPSGNIADIIIMFMLIALYYYAIEIVYGRTLGKIILRMKMTDAKGQKPTKMRLLWRTFLRFGVVMMMLSWRRITLLDWLSGCRVEKIDTPLSTAQKPSLEQMPIGWR